MREFDSAATRDGQPVTEEAAYGDFVREYDMERMAQGANRRGQTLLRGFSSSGSIVIISEQSLPPSTHRKLKTIAPRQDQGHVFRAADWRRGAVHEHRRAQTPDSR
ncbi:hypothetical protein [Streptomyces noursei]|uniref:Uncharacterized protein n=1 Tax=Streptomyces noursei TaxID=1971 RepID=A0A2N8P6K9_STRNR|nr:hypothetical protein [Streptomyces noursei]PNE36617.1 hypothetical protein AOB60_41975 [Streptomyces noursei]